MSLLTRTVTRTRVVPFTPYPGAPAEDVLEYYPVTVPRDWERGVLGAVFAGTGALLTLAVIWSTSSIGGLLALNGVSPYVAYAVAACFDLAWIICMALEWLARYRPRRATAPRRAGYAFLVVSMVAIALREIIPHGKAGIAIGAIGAAVSLVAKGVWTLAIKATSTELSSVAQQYTDRREAAAGTELAMAQVDLQLQRTRGRIAAYREAYGAEATGAQARALGPTINTSYLPDDDVEDDNENLILSALHHLPDAPPAAISATLRSFGRDVTEREIQQVIDMRAVMSPVTSQPQNDQRDDRQDDRRMTIAAATRPVRQMVTSQVDRPMTDAQRLAAARRLDRQARQSKPARPVTIGELQDHLGLSRRDATELRRAVVGKGE